MSVSTSARNSSIQLFDSGSTMRNNKLRAVIASLLFTRMGAATLPHDATICSPPSQLLQLPRSCPPPVDDAAASKTGDWLPWTNPPYCVKPLNKPRSDPPYCVFSSDHYRGGHGLSIITTPKLAARIVDSLDDGIVPPHVRDHPSSFLAGGDAPAPSFEVRDLPGRGKGAVATRKIRQWEVAMVAYPAFISQMDIWEALGADQIRAVLRQAIQQLPGEQQEIIFSLDHSTGGALVQDILNTNIFGIELDGVMHMGLYPETSRLNHACRPNAIWRYSKDNLAMEVVAFRDIEPGEEITHSYTPLGLTQTERQDVLKEWGFTCQCPLCSSSRRAIQQSDRRRNRIRTIRARLESADDGGGGGSLTGDEEVDGLAAELLRLVAEEGLEPQLVVAYMEVWNFEKAREYARMCEEAWVRYGGVEHDNVEGVRLLWRDLREMFTASNSAGQDFQCFKDDQHTMYIDSAGRNCKSVSYCLLRRHLRIQLLDPSQPGALAGDVG
ncbi:hypothetical protein GE09DRAFT_1282611 [Coniochaeta sp. 2T2.1]|nr:hypothetical protein GE09DRAFT_1282611 [Coniochaeta sp. 2T2.1]